MARFEPENNLEMIAEGWRKSESKIPMVMVGNFKNEWGIGFKSRYPDVLFTGANFNPLFVDSMRKYCLCYFHGHSVGGTNPSLVEAMGCGIPIIAHNNTFNRNTLNNNANFFSSSHELSELIKNFKQTEFSKFIQANLHAIRTEYSMEAIGKDYVDVFLEVLKN